MLRKYFLPIFLSISVKLFCQEVDGQKKFTISFGTTIEAGSNELSSKFISKYINGAYIGNNIKDAFFNKLGNNNQAGAFWDSELSLRKYSSSSNDPNRSFNQIALENFYYYEAEFSKDLFGLYFYGNKKYEDQTASLSDMSFKQFNIQVLKIGTYKRLSKIGFGLNLGLALGQSYIDLRTNKSTLYTAPFGKYIDFDLNANALTTDLSRNKFLNANGKGLSLDLKLDYYLNENSKFTIAADRIGFMNFSNLQNQTVDSSFRFEGIVINNLLDSFAINLTTPQEFKDGLVKSTVNNKLSKSLVSQFSLSYKSYLFNKKVQLFAQFKTIPFGIYKPSLQLSLSTITYKTLWLGLAGGTGGFSKWNLGINAGLKLSSFISIRLDANSLFNLYDLNKPTAAIAQLKLSLNL